MASTANDENGPPGVRKAHMPGEEGIWIFIGGDLLVFGLFFVTFLFYRSDDVALYAGSRDTLNQSLGLLNTIILLTSSLCAALAVAAMRRGAGVTASRLLLGSIGLGTGFIVVKTIEWHEKLSAGITLNTNDFFMFYYMYTGIHLVHVLIGIGVLLFAWSVARRPALDATATRTIESCAIFWHLVDLLWVFLFALFYLVR